MTNAGGVTLGGRDNRFRTRINHAHRLPENPGSQRNKWLNGQIQLRAEAAADRSRNNAHRLGSDPENFCDVRTIHVGRLGAGLNLDLVVHPPGKAGFRFDVSMLDKAGLVFAFDDHIRFRQSLFHVTTNHAASHQHIAFAVGMDAWGVGGERGCNRGQCGQCFPGDRKFCEVQRFDGLGLSNYRGDGFASESGLGFGEHRLVGERRNHAVTILAGNVLRSQNAEDSRVLRQRKRRDRRSGTARDGTGSEWRGLQALRPDFHRRRKSPCHRLCPCRRDGPVSGPQRSRPQEMVQRSCRSEHPGRQ